MPPIKFIIYISLYIDKSEYAEMINTCIYILVILTLLKKYILVFI